MGRVGRERERCGEGKLKEGELGKSGKDYGTFTTSRSIYLFVCHRVSTSNDDHSNYLRHNFQSDKHLIFAYKEIIKTVMNYKSRIEARSSSLTSNLCNQRMQRKLRDTQPVNPIDRSIDAFSMERSSVSMRYSTVHEIQEVIYKKRRFS